MKTLLSAVIVFLALSSGTSYASVVTDTIRVPEIQCGMCESKIEKSLKKASYITAIEVDAEHDIVVVSFDDTQAKVADIEKLIAMSGYATTNIPADVAAQNALHGCCKPGAHEEPEAATEADPKPKKVIKKATPSK